MKWVTSILIAAAFISIEAVAQTSDYVPIPTGATWEYRCGFWVDLGAQQQSYEAIKHYYFHLSGDTLINDTAYVMLHEQEEGSSVIHTTSAIRQDTTARKVFARSFLENREFLLYDFSISEGDSIFCHQTQPTFSIFPSNDDGAYWAILHGYEWDVLDSTSNVATVYGVETQPVNTRMYYFTNSSWGRNAIWAEGIGSIMFLTMPCAFDGEFASCNLVGFCAGDTAWYPWESACNVTLGALNPEPTDSYFTAFWDRNSIQIHSDSELENVALFDILGNEIQFGSLQRLGTETWRVENPELPTSGIYMLRYSRLGMIGCHRLFIPDDN